MTKRNTENTSPTRARRKAGEPSATLFTSGPSVLKGDVVFRKVASMPTIFLHPRDAFAKLKT
ncbi:hypothetical protein [Paenibacillus sp. GYB003]|jgi:hypothetical protein|uniref:hypothetical protein n=1 Tax=Paenibacillus sp. GYB003 TaxID=2994392 RepID=UPI002F961B2F